MRAPFAGIAALALVVACGGEGDDPAARPGVPAAVADEGRLGPRDGRDLPPADLDRVEVGDTAPDFALASYDGGVVTLSDYRGRRNVVLVFYRGHW